MTSILPIKETYEVLCDGASKVYDGLSLVFPAIPGWVADRRAECFLSTCKVAQEKLDKAGVSKEQLRHCSLKLGIPLIDHISREDEPSLQELWANLLANALNPNFKSDLRIAYISIIKELSPLDVRVINFLREQSDQKLNWKNALTQGNYYFGYGYNLAEEWEDIEISLENLLRLRLIDTTRTIKVLKASNNYHKNYDNNVNENYTFADNQTNIRINEGLAPGFPHLTILGLAFIKTCVDNAENCNSEPTE